MPFIPHTEADVSAMLQSIGASRLDDLFDEIPAHLRCRPLNAIPDGLSEMDALRRMTDRCNQDAGALCFLGAGAYEHHIPSGVWDVVGRGDSEWLADKSDYSFSTYLSDAAALIAR